MTASPVNPPGSPTGPTAPVVTTLALDLAIKLATEAFFDKLGPGPHNPANISTALIDIANSENMRIEVTTRGSLKGKLERIKNPTMPQVAISLIRLHNVIRIAEEGTLSSQSQLACYLPKGPLKGTYSADEHDINRLARLYAAGLSRSQLADLLQYLRDMAPAKAVCSDRDLIAVNNGIFDYRTKQLVDFTPEIVLLSKSPVDFVENPPAPVIHNNNDDTDWDVDSWLSEIATVPNLDGSAAEVDEEVVEALWQIAGAVIRPLVRWNKAVFPYSTTGNNGKGSYIELLRALTGNWAANIPMADLGKDFLLESLPNSSAIIVDENDVGVFLEKVGNFKALVTQDMLLVNRKGRPAITMRWRGLMVQCLNSLPESRDRSQSFYRRQLFLPFRNRFEGVERKYIKDDYLHRSNVLEYVLNKALMMPDYYELSTPTAGQYLMAEYQLANDNIREYWSDISPELVWDIVPNAYLHDLYIAWMAHTNPSGKPLGRNRFLAAIRELIAETSEWLAPMDMTAGKPAVIRVGTAMDAPEPLTDTYNLTSWMAPGYTGNNWQLRCVPDAKLRSRTRGIIRRGSASSTTAVSAPATN